MWACALLHQQSLTGRPNISKITFLLQNACPSALPFVWPHCSRYRVGRISLFQKVFFQFQIQPHLIQHKNIRLDFCIWTDFGTVDYRALGLLWHSQAGGHSQLHSQVWNRKLQIFSPIHSLGPIHEVSNTVQVYLQFVFVDIFSDWKYFLIAITSIFVASYAVPILIGFRTVLRFGYQAMIAKLSSDLFW